MRGEDRIVDCNPRTWRAAHLWLILMLVLWSCSGRDEDPKPDDSHWFEEVAAASDYQEGSVEACKDIASRPINQRG